MKNKRWLKMSKIGKLKFIVIYGFMFFIVSSSLFFIYGYFSGNKTSNYDLFFIELTLLITSFFWSAGYWNQMNKKYDS